MDFCKCNLPGALNQLSSDLLEEAKQRKNEALLWLGAAAGLAALGTGLYCAIVQQQRQRQLIQY
jgi:hypothetical protein